MAAKLALASFEVRTFDKTDIYDTIAALKHPLPPPTKEVNLGGSRTVPRSLNASSTVVTAETQTQPFFEFWFV